MALTPQQMHELRSLVDARRAALARELDEDLDRVRENRLDNVVGAVPDPGDESVQKLIQSSGIPEKIEIGASQGSDGLHEEYGIDALMALYDPKTIRIDERTKANRATINGVDLLPMSKTLEMGRKIVELRTKLTVDAINKAIAQ